jgi:Zn finger protein HypA/HybF involved in hydrogenase expression
LEDKMNISDVMRKYPDLPQAVIEEVKEYHLSCPECGEPIPDWIPWDQPVVCPACEVEFMPVDDYPESIYPGHCFDCGHDWEETWSAYKDREGWCPKCDGKQTKLYVTEVEDE